MKHHNIAWAPQACVCVWGGGCGLSPGVMLQGGKLVLFYHLEGI